MVFFHSKKDLFIIQDLSHTLGESKEKPLVYYQEDLFLKLIYNFVKSDMLSQDELSSQSKTLVVYSILRGLQFKRELFLRI